MPDDRRTTPNALTDMTEPAPHPADAMPAADRLMREAVAGSVFPGGVLLVSQAGRTLCCGAYGRCSLFSCSPVAADTLFDLASLTKPLATTLAVLLLCQQGRLDVGQRLGALLPAFETGAKAGITLSQLLTHSSGLPAYRPYYLQLEPVHPRRRKTALMELLAREPLEYPPGEGSIYSDLDFMILGWVVEAVAGRRLDRFVAEAVYAPLGAASLFFIDLAARRPAGPYAATEHCHWRGRLLEGEVHDENAFVLGGVAGHAGLFGTAAAVERLLDELLAAYHGPDGGRLFRTDAVRRFLGRVPGTGRTLGFDMPSGPEPSCGRYFSAMGVGHLGFTGTSFWIHLERRISVVLLTNRVHPSRANTAIRAFRPLIHDAVMESLA
jgi:CubicO group peptidase (beta-lactamase class C family)